MKYKSLSLIRIFKFLLTGTILSQEQDKSKSRCHYLDDVYLMFPTMSGNISVGDLPPVEIDAGAGDIFSHIKMGAMFYFEATNDDWAVSSDLIYMKLGQDVKSDGILVTGGDVTMKQTAWELAGLKRITSWLEAGLGGRIVSLYTGLNLQTINEPREGSAQKTWFDPIIILRAQGAIKDKWLLQFRGDIG